MDVTHKEQEKWDMIIQPRRRWFDLHLRDLWRYRDLISLFVKRDFVTFYKQTILGPLWYLIQPLLITIVFTLIFGKLARISTDGIPPFLFYLAGNMRLPDNTAVQDLSYPVGGITALVCDQ